MPVLLASLAAFMYGASDFAGGFASRRNSVFSVIFFSQVAGLLTAFLAIPLVSGGAPAGADLAWGFTAGVFGLVGIAFLYRGIGRGIVAVVSPVSALMGALAPMLFGIFSGETPNLSGWIGAGLCLPGAFLLTWEGSPKPRESSVRLEGEGHSEGQSRDRILRQSLLYGLVAGLGFGGFFIAVSRSGGDSGLWPLVAARGTSLILVGAAALSLRRPLMVSRGSRKIAIIAGLFDMGANIAFLLATRVGMLSLVSVITALYPGPTVLMARIFLGQRLGPVKAAGVLLALVGTALIGLA